MQYKKMMGNQEPKAMQVNVWKDNFGKLYFVLSQLIKLKTASLKLNDDNIFRFISGFTPIFRDKSPSKSFPSLTKIFIIAVLALLAR